VNTSLVRSGAAALLLTVLEGNTHRPLWLGAEKCPQVPTITGARGRHSAPKQLGGELVVVLAPDLFGLVHEPCEGRAKPLIDGGIFAWHSYGSRFPRLVDNMVIRGKYR